MSEQDEPERRFVVEKKPIMRELDSEPAHPNLVAGAEMSVIAFFGDILRRMDRRRAAKNALRIPLANSQCSHATMGMPFKQIERGLA